MSFDEVIRLFTAIMGSITAIAAMAWFFFGIVAAYRGWKNGKDANHSLRRGLHISYIKTFNKLFKDIDENKRVTDNDSLIEIMSSVEISAGKIKNKGFKKLIFDKEIIVKELRDMKNMDGDFYLNLKLPMSLFLKKTNINNIKLNKETAPKLLILVATTIFTEHINLLSYDEKYEELVYYLKHFNTKNSKNALLRYIK